MLCGVARRVHMAQDDTITPAGDTAETLAQLAARKRDSRDGPELLAQVTPEPVRPVWAPLAAQQLAYSQPPRRGRPGLITAIGVMSIVVGSLSILFSLQTGFQAVGLIFLSRMASKSNFTSSSSVAVTASGTAGAGVVGSTTTPTTVPSTALTPAEIQNVISKVQARLSARKLNAAQVAALQGALAAPSQQLVTPGTAWSPVRSCLIHSNGTAIINLSGGFIRIDSNAANITQFSYAAGSRGMPHVALMPCILSLFDGVASLCLAVILLVAGIGTLRHSRRSLRLHQIYGWTKLPLAIVGGIAYGLTLTQVVTSMPGFGNFNAYFLFAIYAGFVVLVGCAYPVGLLIALRTRAVRGYYQS